MTPNYFDRLFIHSLGYANDAYGQIYIQAQNVANPNANFEAPTGAAIGMPRGAQTYQSFPWANRPFISAGEIMQVPASSQATPAP